MKKFKKLLKKKFFMGELMTCYRCGKQEQSHPNQQSQWTVVELEGDKPMYFCPECFGNGRQPPNWWKK